MIKVNFSWIGPPPAELRGHDTDGPDQFLQRFNTPDFSPATHELFFFCLQKYYSHYQQHFKGKPIHVVAIEVYLEQIINNCAELNETGNRARKLLELMRIFLAAERDSIRDRVSVKNQFHYFLGCVQGGYLFDTNIKPAAQFIALPSYTEFVISAVQLPINKLNDIDIFAFYCPAGNQIAQIVFDKHLQGLINNESHENKTSRQYYKAISRNLMPDLFMNWQAKSKRYWTATRSSGKRMEIKELGVIKEQENTHKHHLRKTYEREHELTSALLNHGLFCNTSLSGQEPLQKLIIDYCWSLKEKEDVCEKITGKRLEHDDYHDAFFQICLGNTDKLREYIEQGLDLQMVVNKSWKNGMFTRGDTLLHKAVEYGKFEICQLILSYPEGRALCFEQAEYKYPAFQGAVLPIEWARYYKQNKIVLLLDECMKPVPAPDGMSSVLY